MGKEDKRLRIAVSSDDPVRTNQVHFSKPIGSVIESAEAVRTASLMVEYKAPVPAYRGSRSPTLLNSPVQEFRYDPTPGSSLLQTAFGRLVGDKVYAFRLGVNLHMSSSGAGIVNSAINISNVGTIAQFTDLAGLFNEFFVVRAHLRWEPASMYNGPIGYLPASTVSSLGIGVIALQHGAAAVTTISQATNQYAFAWHNTGRPFKYTWVNSESAKTGLVVEGATATQAWCLTSNSSAYSGQVQIISDVSPVLPNSAILGSFVVEFDVLFRLRD
jgi:hypothetical protein